MDDKTLAQIDHQIQMFKTQLGSVKDSRHTVFDDVEETQSKIENAAKDMMPVVNSHKGIRDSYGNSLLSVGTDDKVATFTNYGFSNDSLNWTLWLALYNDSWVFRRAIDKPAQDEIRCGIELQGDYNKDAIYRMLKKHRFELIQLLQWGALFGGSVAVMMFDNLSDPDYEKPLDKEKIKQSKCMRMYVTDRWYGCAPDYSCTVTNMEDSDFGKPKFYSITFADNKTLRVHHSYVLRYEHRTAPKLVKNGMLQGWGYAEGSHILNELARDDKLKASIQSLIDKSLIEVIKMSGMRGIFMGADSDNEQQLRKRLEMVNWGRNFNSLTFLDTDDDYQQNTYSGLSGLSDLLEKNMWLVSAALEMQGVLFGDLKQGFSDDTNALERYDITILGRCESYVRPVHEKLIKVLMLMKGIDAKVEFEYKSLLADKQDEKALEALDKFTNLCSKLLQDGVITTQQYAKAMVDYTNKGLIDFNMDEKYIEGLEDKMKEEIEGLEL